MNEQVLLDEIWHMDDKTILRAAYEITKLLLKINDIIPKKWRLKQIDSSRYRVYLAKFMKESIGSFRQFYVELDYKDISEAEILRIGKLRTLRFTKSEIEDRVEYYRVMRAEILSMPKHPVYIVGRGPWRRTPFGTDKYCLHIGVAYYWRLDWDLIYSYEEYEKKHGKINANWFSEMKRIWLEDSSFNMLDKNKLRSIRKLIWKFASKTYQGLLRGLRAVEKANEELNIDYLHLWIDYSVKTPWLGCSIDATQMTVRELLKVLPERIKAVSFILKKLEEVYRAKPYYQVDQILGRTGIYIGPYAHQWTIAEWR